MTPLRQKMIDAKLSRDQQQWHPANNNYLFPVRALSRHFRGAMVSALRNACTHGDLHRLTAEDVERNLNQLMSHDWVVYSKAYLQKADTIVRYLGRYSHKIALSDARIKTITDTQVSFRYKDYRDNHDKCMQLDGEEFIRRFLMHVLPQGFMRIRHYGFLSNRRRRQKLETIRACLQRPLPTINPETPNNIPQGFIDHACPCPRCDRGRLHIRYEIPAKPMQTRVTMNT